MATEIDEGSGASDPIPRRYLFWADDSHREGPIGRGLGPEADSADIQEFHDHVLRKESRLTSRFLSFTTELKIATRFTARSDRRSIRKAEWGGLKALESRGILRIWEADQVFEALKSGGGKAAKQAGDVRAAMRRNREVLIEGQLPAEILSLVNE